MLTGDRRDLIADRVRRINRVRDLLVGICSTLDRAFDYSWAKGPGVLLIECQAPAVSRRIGVKRLITWLERRKVRSAEAVAAKAVEAAQSEDTALPGEGRASNLLRDLAHQLLALGEQIKDNDRGSRETFMTDDRAEIIESIPSMGPILGAEFFVVIGGLSGHRNAGSLPCQAGLAPVLHNSGRRTGDYHRPKRYNRRLRWLFSMSAQSVMMSPWLSRDLYLKKRREELIHTQAMLELARRLVDVLRATLRDDKPFTSVPPVTLTA